MGNRAPPVGHREFGEMNIIKKATLATALAASALVSATPAMARDNYRRHDGGDEVAAAVVGGVIGIALGAIIASGNDRDDRYYDRRYQRDGAYYRDDRYYRDGRYYNRERYRDDRGYYARRGYSQGDYYGGY
jgi:hypothetical protein